MQRFAGALNVAANVNRLRLVGAEPAVLLARLFLVGAAVERDAAGPAVAPAALDDLIADGLLVADADEVVLYTGSSPTTGC